MQEYKTVSVSLVNSKTSVVVSGSPDEIESLAKSLTKSGIAAREVGVRVPFHSPHMAAALRILADDLHRENLWDAFHFESLSFPVAIRGSPSGVLLYALAEHICLHPVDWISESRQVTDLQVCSPLPLPSFFSSIF